MSRRRGYYVGAEIAITGFYLLCLWIAMPIQPAFATERAFLRVVQADPDLGTVDIAIDGETFLHNFSFAMVSGYVSLPAGSHHLSLIQPRQKAPLFDIFMVVSPSVPYTFAIIEAHAKQISLQAFIDDNVLSSNGAKMRFYQLAPHVGDLTLLIGGVVVSHLHYQNTSEYLTVPAGTYTLEIRQDTFSKQTMLTESLGAETVNSIFALSTGINLPVLRFIHTSVVGMPGPPIAGSDPSPIRTTEPPWPWYLLLLSAVGLTLCRAFNRGHPK